MGHKGVSNSFVSKNGQKSIEIFQFFLKKRTKTRDFSFNTASQKKSTTSESGPYSGVGRCPGRRRPSKIVDVDASTSTFEKKSTFRRQLFEMLTSTFEIWCRLFFDVEIFEILEVDVGFQNFATKKKILVVGLDLTKRFLTLVCRDSKN